MNLAHFCGVVSGGGGHFERKAPDPTHTFGNILNFGAFLCLQHARTQATPQPGVRQAHFLGAFLGKRRGKGKKRLVSLIEGDITSHLPLIGTLHEMPRTHALSNVYNVNMPVYVAVWHINGSFCKLLKSFLTCIITPNL